MCHNKSIIDDADGDEDNHNTNKNGCTSRQTGEHNTGRCRSKSLFITSTFGLRCSIIVSRMRRNGGKGYGRRSTFFVL